MEEFFSNRSIELYASGTAALSRAIAECSARSSANAPEVILPAYGCPDLVAACLRASVYPRLVDIAAQGWRYDPDALAASLTCNTVAIVAVNLLGVGDDSYELSTLCGKHRIPLIQDSAQHLPRIAGTWPGEYVVLSFGRGKPLNLLYGGALVKSAKLRKILPALPAHYAWRDRLLATRAAAVAFNALTRPHIYHALSSVPGTGLGRVAYHPLRNTSALPEGAWQQVGTAFQHYRLRSSYSRAIWNQAIEAWLSLGIEPLEQPASPPDVESLRLALLAPDRTARDDLVHRLSQRGLGATRFYGTALNRVTGIPDEARQQGPFPNANSLADRLLTLPTHPLVTPQAVTSACIAVSAWHGIARLS